MKKFIFILAFIGSVQMSAQKENAWLTDYKVALQQSESQEKPILVYVTDNQISEQSNRLDKEFFGSEAYKKSASKLILLKLDISDEKSINNRVGSHYLKQKSATGLALVDENNNTISDPLVAITSENILNFITLINDRL